MFHQVIPDFIEYLRDESRLTGEADTISFPRNEAEIREILSACSAREILVTVQGARTGIVGGAVPREGHILNLSRMNRVLGLQYSQEYFTLTVQPGVLLQDINAALSARSFNTETWDAGSLQVLERFKREPAFFFPPDPTEATASIGGMAAGNASGTRTFFYGPTREHIEALNVVLADGSLMELKRGGQRARGRAFHLKADTGRLVKGKLPDYRMPEVKNAAGFYVKDDMDLLDLFIGSEGTLGIITELELKLSPLPKEIWGIMCFLPDEEQVVCFVRTLRGEQAVQEAAPAGKPTALEFFDSKALALLRRQKQQNPAFAELPEIPEEKICAVYVEYHAEDEGQMEELVFAMAEILNACGGDEENTWMASNPRELERLKDFRHALPEAVNLLIDERRKKEPELTKLGTDMAVPDSELGNVLAMYESDLAHEGIEYVKFGHIGNNHIHVNILPVSLEEYERGKGLYRRWAEKVVALGGTVSAEHGIGRLKVEFLKSLYGSKAIREMLSLRKLFDPQLLLNRYNISPPKNLSEWPKY